MPQQLTEPDPFGDALMRFFETGRGAYTYTRSDGRRDKENAAVYFTNYAEFPRFEKQALKFARGHVLDIGCGAGRHALYLQRKGHHVTGIDSSPQVAAIASARGVRNVHVASVCKRLPFQSGAYDTILLFGNNLGICGSHEGVAKMLRELARVTKPNARILTTTRNPGTFDAKHRAYWNKELAAGNEFGVARYCIEFEGKKKWVSLLLLAPSELMELAWKTGWQVQGIFGDGHADEGYAAVLEKRQV